MATGEAGDGGERFDTVLLYAGVEGQLGFLGAWAYSTWKRLWRRTLDGLPAGARVALVPRAVYVCKGSKLAPAQAGVSELG